MQVDAIPVKKLVFLGLPWGASLHDTRGITKIRSSEYVFISVSRPLFYM